MNERRRPPLQHGTYERFGSSPALASRPVASYFYLLAAGVALERYSLCFHPRKENPVRARRREVSEISFAKFDYYVLLRGQQTLLEPGKQNIVAELTERGVKLILIFKICYLRGRNDNVIKRGLS